VAVLVVLANQSLPTWRARTAHGDAADADVLRGVRKQGNLPRALHCRRDRPLALRAAAHLATAFDLAVLVQEAAQGGDVLVVDHQWLRHADVAAPAPTARTIVSIAAVTSVIAVTTVASITAIAVAVVSVKCHQSLLLWGSLEG
jgi:hypothetical protein